MKRPLNSDGFVAFQIVENLDNGLLGLYLNFGGGYFYFESDSPVAVWNIVNTYNDTGFIGDELNCYECIPYPNDKVKLLIHVSEDIICARKGIGKIAQKFLSFIDADTTHLR